ncbi:MAG: hypothetical protein M0Q24_11475 [Sulfurimonas sp.]|uniref:hypothetical protein n=1 Tax=Sulfurimonas sp. TaxID=2022749 RepID=UPI0025FB687B|nr:hypothetical protein [Sulfurimonas sp.]MCK9492691.1 hypothetical protein [Sulfurimonas sp.]
MVRNGISSKSPQRYALGPGEIRLNYVDGDNPGTLFGATMGGNSFIVEMEIRDTRPDGARGKMKGFRNIDAIEARIEANMLEISRESLLRALPGASGEVEGDHFKITPGLAISANSYLDNVAILGNISGSDTPFVGIIKNVLADEGLELAFQDRDDIVQPITFSAHFDAADATTVPFEVRFPADVVT